MDADKALVQQDPFQAMERMDEEQVLDEIKGRALDSLVYEIRQGGQPVVGLSLAGVREVARKMNTNGGARIGIADREPIIIETDDYFEVKIYAQDAQNGGGYWGIKRQTKKYSNGNLNQFALEQALAKAQRNALRGLIPEYFAKEMIDAFRQNGKAKTIDASHRSPAPPREQPKAEQPKQAPDPQTNGGPVRNLSIKVPPAVWNGFLSEVAEQSPTYMENGKPNNYHIVNAIKKLGYSEINDDNANEIRAMLKTHAEQKETEKATA